MKILLLILFPICLKAQTRLYENMQFATSPLVTPNSSWITNEASTMRPLMRVPNGTSFIIITSNQFGVTVTKHLFSKFISEPLGNQTLNGTLVGQSRFKRSNNNTLGIIYIRIVNPNGTVAQELGSSSTTAITNASTYENRSFPAITLSGVVITAGQRLVIEAGFDYNAASGVTTATAAMERSSLPAIGDLPIDNVNQTQLNPWFEFSQTLTFMNGHLGFF